MRATNWKCRRCRERLLFYDIGFDSGYQCPRCKSILEFHELKAGAIRVDDAERVDEPSNERPR